MTITSSNLIRFSDSTTIRQRVMKALVADGLMDPQRGPNPRITSNAEVVLKRRYLAKDREGKPVEDVDQMFRRVARNLAGADQLYGATEDEVSDTEEAFYRAMKGLEFLPNSPTLMNAGRELQQLSACFVLPVKDSLDSIFEMVKATALIHKSGGGTGFAFSQLRPSGDVVGSTGGIASGPVSFIRAFDTATDVVKQGGTRRGANMGILHVTHPDIMKFIHSKEDGQNLSNFNISVAVTEEFMRKAEKGEEYDLINPRTGVVTKQLNAGDVFKELVDMAWTTGDPGIIFLDRINRDNPNPQLGEIESTNPCGEQPLLPFRIVQPRLTEPCPDAEVQLRRGHHRLGEAGAHRGHRCPLAGQRGRHEQLPPTRNRRDEQEDPAHRPRRDGLRRHAPADGHPIRLGGGPRGRRAGDGFHL